MPLQPPSSGPGLAQPGEFPKYNTLGQILARGGEIPVARAILRGVTPEELIRTFRERFAPVRDKTIEQVASFASRMISAGNLIMELPQDIVPPINVIPVNPALFGDDWFGNRVQLVVQGGVEGNDSAFDVWIDLPDLTAFEEIWNIIVERANAIIESDPKAAERLGLYEARKIAIRQILAERRY